MKNKFRICHQKTEKSEENYDEEEKLYKCADEVQIIDQLQEKLEMSRGEIKQILQKL